MDNKKLLNFKNNFIGGVCVSVIPVTILCQNPRFILPTLFTIGMFSRTMRLGISFMSGID